MPAPHNPFKNAIAKRELQIGCWLGLADPYTAEISAGAGFDWLLIDAEHAPNDLRSVVAQLQVIAARGSHAIVRPPIGETWMIKQFLDAGAQSLLVPMVETAEQASELVSAVTYPPHGVRGVGSALGRASDFAAIKDYLTTARDEICLLIQVESRKGLAALDDILAVFWSRWRLCRPLRPCGRHGFHRPGQCTGCEGRRLRRNLKDRRVRQGRRSPDLGQGSPASVPGHRRKFRGRRNRRQPVCTYNAERVGSGKKPPRGSWLVKRLTTVLFGAMSLMTRS